LKLPLKPLLLTIAGAATLYALALLLSGNAPWARLAAVLVSAPGLLAAGLCLLSYLLRGQRWRLWMAQHGRVLPVARGLRLYLAGYAFTPTPGNVGEAMRGLLLRPPLSAGASVAIYGAERLADLLALLLLTLPVVPWLIRRAGSPPWLLTSIAAILLAGLLTAALSWHWRTRILAKLPWLHGIVRCLLPRPGRWLSLTVLAWSAQGWAVWLLAHELAVSLSPALATGLYALAMVGGALSFLPAGLGGTEAMLTALLTLAGVPLPMALLLTVLARLLTLWLAVAVGALALFYSAALRRDITLR